MKRLDEKEIKSHLKDTHEWLLEESTIKREFNFGDFKKALEFVNKVGKIAEDDNHHPDVYIFYNKVILKLSTHSIDGLSEKDFMLARKINKLL